MIQAKVALPPGWTTAKLDQVADWGSGGTPSRKNPKFFEGTIPWFKTGELGSKYINQAEESLSIEAIRNSSAKVFPAGSVGIAMYGATIGKLSIWGVEASTNQACAVAQPFREILHNEYLYYFLLSERRALVDAGKGGAQPNISQGILKDWSIRLPPPNEQRRIVAKIEELFSELDKGVESLKLANQQLQIYRQAVLKHAFEGGLTAQWREDNKDELIAPDKSLNLLKNKRQKYFQNMLNEWKAAVSAWERDGKRGPKPRKPSTYKDPKLITPEELEVLPALPQEWMYVRLSEVASIGSGMSVSASRKLVDPVEVPYLRVANVRRGCLDLTEIKSMHVEKSQLPALALRRWDVLFNEGGDRDKLGRGWIWQSEIDPCITQNHVFRTSLFDPSEQSSTVLSHWGNTFGRRYFEETGKQTTNLASINKTVLSDFPVPLISRLEQEEICQRLDQAMTVIDAQQAEIDAALEHCEVLRQLILNSAFSGNLVRQDPTDEPAIVLLERVRVEKEHQAEPRKKTNKRKRRKDAA